MPISPLLEVGNVVRLKSGSPRLNVTHVAGKRVTVQWIAYGSGTPQKLENVPQACLRKESI